MERLVLAIKLVTTNNLIRAGIQSVELICLLSINLSKIVYHHMLRLKDITTSLGVVVAYIQNEVYMMNINMKKPPIKHYY